MFKSLARAISPFSMKKPVNDTKSVKEEEEEDDEPPSIYDSYTWDLNGVNLSMALFFFYSQYNPSKVNRVEQIVKEFEGEEILMLQEICERYQLSENDMQRFLEKGRKAQEDRKSATNERKEFFDIGYTRKDTDFDPNEDLNVTNYEKKMKRDQPSSDSEDDESEAPSVASSQLTSSNTVKSSQIDTSLKKPPPLPSNRNPTPSKVTPNVEVRAVTPPVPPPRPGPPGAPPPPPVKTSSAIPPPPRPGPPIAPPPPRNLDGNRPPLPRQSINAGTTQEVQQKEVIRPAVPILPPLVMESNQSNVVESEEKRNSTTISPDMAKKLAQQRILELAQRAKSPGHTEIMQVGGQKVSLSNKPPPTPAPSMNPPRPPPPRPPMQAKQENSFLESDQLNDPSNDFPNSKTALFFHPQESTMKASVVAASNRNEEDHEDNLSQDDDQTHHSDLSRDDFSQISGNRSKLSEPHSIRSQITLKKPVEAGVQDDVVKQLKLELEQARNVTKDMFKALTDMMQQQNEESMRRQLDLQKQIPPPTLSIPVRPLSTFFHTVDGSDRDKIVSEEAKQSPSKHYQDQQEHLKTIAGLENDLKSLKYENRRIFAELEDLRADKRDLLQLLNSVSISQASGKAVLESYVSQYGLGVNDSTDDLVTRIDSVLRYRRLNDFNDFVNNPIQERLLSSTIASLSNDATKGKSPTKPNESISILGSPKAVPGMAKSHTVILQELLENNEALEPHRQYTQSAINKLIEPSIPFSGNTNSRSRVSSSPLPGTKGGINDLRISSGGLISSSQSVSSSNSIYSDSQTPISSRYMNINSNVVWDPVANKRIQAVTQTLNRGNISSGSSTTSSTGYSTSTGRRSYSPRVTSSELLRRYDHSSDAEMSVLSPRSFSKSLNSPTRHNHLYRDPYNPSRTTSSDRKEKDLADQYELAKDYYRSNITQAKVQAQLAQNRLNYQTGLTSQAMIESMLALHKEYHTDDDNDSRYSDQNSNKKYINDGYPDDWVEGWDDVRKRKYFYSKSRKKSVWRLPDGSKGASRPSSRASSPMPSSTTNESYRTASPRKMQSFHNKNGDKGQASSWVPVFDPKSQRQYWYHSVTRQTSWIKPTEN